MGQLVQWLSGPSPMGLALAIFAWMLLASLVSYIPKSREAMLMLRVSPKSQPPRVTDRHGNGGVS